VSRRLVLFVRLRDQLFVRTVDGQLGRWRAQIGVKPAPQGRRKRLGLGSIGARHQAGMVGGECWPQVLRLSFGDLRSSRLEIWVCMARIKPHFGSRARRERHQDSAAAGRLERRAFFVRLCEAMQAIVVHRIGEVIGPRRWFSWDRGLILRRSSYGYLRSRRRRHILHRATSSLRARARMARLSAAWLCA